MSMFSPYRLRQLAQRIPGHRYRTVSDARPFRPNDLVLLRRKDDRTAPPILSKSLKPGRRIESHKGVVLHDDIIGKSVRDLVYALPKRQRSRDGESTDTGAGKEKERAGFRLHEVKLEAYVRLTRRLVTPIYPADARLIVDLLDLHPTAASKGLGGDRLEILEAGTGHGSLTLYLARAVAGANAHIGNPETFESELNGEIGSEAWQAERKAIVHTIDISEKYSNHAETIVAGFKSGLYRPHVDFHVGDVADWTAAELARRKEEQGDPGLLSRLLSGGKEGDKAFLLQPFLDLPNANGKVEVVTRALRVDGTLIVFNPSITQILDVAKKVKDDDIPLELERVVELGVNGGSGGREWDVRPVKPRGVQKAMATEENGKGEHEAGEDSGFEVESDEEQVATEEKAKGKEDAGWSMVCRPKVGDRVIGGGFLGVWKKQRQEDGP